jgi:hypothetical protein
MIRTVVCALVALSFAACGGGGGGDGGDSTALFADAFDGPFPGTSWQPTGTAALDPAAGAPAPCLLVGDVGDTGSARTVEQFPTAGGLAVSVLVRGGQGAQLALLRPDLSTFAEIEVQDENFPDNVYANAGGTTTFGGDLQIDGQFHEFSIEIDPDTTVRCLIDGVVIVEDSTPFGFPAAVHVVLRAGTIGSQVRFDQVLVTQP